MAKYTIININKLTCGTRRGLIDVDVRIDDLMPDVYLLPATNQQYTPLSSKFDPPYNNGGIATESNTNYEYVRNIKIYDYPQSGNLSILNQEKVNQEEVDKAILLEDQLSIDIDTYNDDLSAKDGLSGSDAIQLTPEFWLLSADDARKVFEFNSQASCMRMVFEFEIDHQDNQKACLSSNDCIYFPLNDILDLCIKSMFKRPIINYNIPGNLLLENYAMTYSKNIDQYFVFEENPIDICQHNNDAFAISQPMLKQPYRMQSNLQSQIRNNVLDDMHSFQLQQDDIETILYDANSTTFIPKKYVKGIGYNYIVDVEQNINSNQQFDNPTIYDNGDIFGFFVPGKNMYNALYSMDMKSANEIHNCREYAGIQSLGNKIILKYYDNVDYKFKSNAQEKQQLDAEMLSSSSSFTKQYPYQKVETFDPISFKNATRHKSNLFSIKISKSGLDDSVLKNCTDDEKKLAENIKCDITNAIRALAKSIAPANTQFFKTYFMK